MSITPIQLTPDLYEYLLDISLRENPVLAELRQHSKTMGLSNMIIAPEQGQFISLLIKLMGAKRTLDIGVFIGYSSSVVALALPKEGQIVACDSNAEWTKIAQKTWATLGVAERIDFRLAPALDTLQSLIDNGEREQFDFAFIDADKINYKHYYECCLQLIRPGGLIAIDNTLWKSKLIDPKEQGGNTQHLREFNAFLHQDSRIDISVIPIGDGTTLARKV